MHYRHTQYGALMFAVLLLVAILVAVVAVEIISQGRSTAAVTMIFVYLLGVVMFYSSTVEVSGRQVRFWFGIGLVRRNIPLDTIQAVREVVNPWYYFWGIKSIPGGWLYAIAPGPAVEIKLMDGKVIHLGSNQTRELKEAIGAAMQTGG